MTDYDTRIKATLDRVMNKDAKTEPVQTSSECVPLTYIPREPQESICQTAQRITTQGRRDEYGHPADDFARIAALWTTFLDKQLTKPITAKQVTIMQILLKTSRMVHSPNHTDSAVDIAGYANCWGMIHEKEQ